MTDLFASSSSNLTPPTHPKEVLVSHAASLGNVARELGLPELADSIIEETRRRLDDHRIRAVVLGEIKQGKSTLINAMIGDDALPTGVTPTTAAVATVRVGEGPGMFECHGQDRCPVDAERFTALATGRETPPEGSTIELVVGAGALPPTLEIIDTPGMNDMERVRGAISRGELPRADALVLVLDATQLLNRTEMAFLRDAVSAVGGLTGTGAQLFLVINRIDLVAESDRPQLVEYLEREVNALVDDHGRHAIEIFQTDARGALRRPDDDAPGVEQVRMLRQRLVALAHTHAEILPARARAGLVRYAALLAHNAAIAARALTLEELALRREIRAIEREVIDHQADLAGLREQLGAGRQTLEAQTKARIARFSDDLLASALACIESANLRTLSEHLPGSLHDALLAFTREESERLRVELEELTRQAMQTHGEQARRRLFQVNMRLGFRGPPIYVEPPSIALEAGLVAVGLAGTAVMYFGGMVAGLTMTIAGPLATVLLREKSLADARLRAKEAVPEALERTRGALVQSIGRVIEQHVAAVEEHLVLANVALGRQLVGVLERARERLGQDDDPEASQRRHAAQEQMLELERTLHGLRQSLQNLDLAVMH